MMKSSKQLISLIMSFFLCLSNFISVQSEDETASDNEKNNMIKDEKPWTAADEEEYPEAVTEEENFEEEIRQEENITEKYTEAEEPLINGTEQNQTDFYDEEIDEAISPEDNEDSIGAAAPASDFTYIISDGELYITSYQGNEIELEIPEEINGYRVKHIAYMAFCGLESEVLKNIRVIKIPEGVETIDEYAFSDCINLVEILLPSSLTSLGNGVFYECASLQSITIPNGVTSINDYTFEFCYSLKKAEIPDSVKSIGREAFASCTSLTDIALPDSITNIGVNAFLECSSLSNLVLPKNLDNVESASFSKCSSLISIKIPDSVKSIGESAFYDCVKLESLIIGRNVQSIGKEAFDHCTSLKELKLPASVIDIEQNAFSSCDSLVFIRLPANLPEIKKESFGYCNMLPSIEIPDKVSFIREKAFFGCYRMTSIVIPVNLSEIGEEAFAYCNGLEDVYYKGTEEQWKEITIGDNNDCLLKAKIHYSYAGTTKVEGISFDKENIEIAVNDSQSLSYVIIPENASNKNVTWASSDEQVVEVNENGKLTALSAGTAVIIAETEDGGFTAQCTVTVHTVSAEGIIVNEEDSVSELEFGKTGIIHIVFRPANTTNQNLTWESSDNNIATVDETGLIKAVGEGPVTITATSLDGGFSASKEITVIYHHVESVAFENEKTETAVGKTKSLHVLFNPENSSNKAVTYSSGDENIVIVDREGNVTGVSVGTAEITVSTEDGNRSATCFVTVTPKDIYVKNLESSYVYTGTTIKPEIRVYDSDILLHEKIDYTITYKNNLKAYTLTEDDPGFNAKKAPQIILKSNNKGNYKGSKTVYFAIDPIDLNDDSITVDALSVQATGKTLSPVPAVYFNGKKLKAKTDYIVDYTGWDRLTGDENNEAVITVIAKEDGNFSGERKVTIYVAPKGTTVPVSKLKVTAATLKYEDLTEENFAEKVADAITVKDGKTSLQEGINYTIKDIKPEDRAVGSFKVTLEGNDSKYIGERTVTVKITGIALSDKKVKVLTGLSYPYTGEEITFTPAAHLVSYNGKDLTEGTDYVIDSYTKNLNAGTGTVTLKGINNYTGTKKVNFKITPVIYEEGNPEFDIDVNDAVYCKGGTIPEVHVFWNGTELNAGTDYTLKCADNKKVTDGSVSKWPTVTITFKGNYKGTVRRDFFIDPKPLDLVTITAKDKVYSAKANAWKSAPVLKDTDGKTLKAGTDYDKNITYTTEDGDELPAVVEPGTVIKVTVTGKGSYTGTAEVFYHILETGKDISKATFKITNKEYTGSEVTLTAADITATINKTTPLELDTHYEIAGYTNNIKKGTAKVTFRGKGEYGGEKTVTFKIGQRSIITYWKGIMSFFSELF